MELAYKLHGGKKPATYDKRDILYADIRSGLSLPTPPNPPFGLADEFQTGSEPSGWGMMGNGPCDDGSVNPNWAAFNGAGDCTLADPVHATMAFAKSVGRPIPRFTSLSALEEYSKLSGYNLQNGNNDNGLEIRQVLQYRQNPGLLDADGNRHQIGTYVALEPGNWSQLQEAVWLFDGVSIGITVTQSMMDQFNAGKAWSVVPGMMNNQLGGHDVPILGRPQSGWWSVVTWAGRTTISAALLSMVCDEMWAYIDPERYSQVTGETYNGYKDADLEKYLTLVAQQKVEK